VVRQPESKGTLSTLATQAGEDSRRWFPGDFGVPYYALCLGGEVGEFQNIVKKIERGSLDPRAASVRHDMAMELTDAFVYMLCLADKLGIDLEKSYNVKRIENERRFGPNG
jgi:NTP pyrophosphatase (non-canonical NTP hydrolase)